MHSLAKSYNRKYYRSLAKIHAKKHAKRIRIELVAFLLKLACKIDEKLVIGFAMEITKQQFRIAEDDWDWPRGVD